MGIRRPSQNFNERAFGYWLTAHPTADVSDRPALPESMGPGSTLWMQTSAEYAAICRQTYQAALKQLCERTRANRKVIMDLDETMLDNSGYQASQLLRGEAYDEKSWEAWELWKSDQVGLVPGAAEFIKEAKSEGASITFVSNRLEKYRDVTIKLLERLRVTAGDPSTSATWLMLRTDGSSKASRYRQLGTLVSEAILIGDNMADFGSDWEAGAFTGESPWTARYNRVSSPDVLDNLGVRWFCLPNPAYGDWQKAVSMRPLGKILDVDRFPARR
jgi:5'-nucleotidase (lipoprotein e(P4) family)